MTHEEIERVISAFGDAAVRAQKGGFNGIQLHGCHGFLITQFLSPGMNLRRDGWGGDAARRREFLRRVIGEIRSRVFAEFPVWIKLGVGGGEAWGPPIEEGLETVTMCVEEGIDCIEVSHGFGVPKRYDGKQPLWFLPVLERVRNAVGPEFPSRRLTDLAIFR